MKILITGSKGFVGRNLVSELKNRDYNNLFEYDLETDKSLLEKYCSEADFVFHLAGVNRTNNETDFMDVNHDFTLTLLNTLKKYNNKCPVMISSSIQAEYENPYGISKKAGENLLIDYNKDTGAKIYIYRFPNIFGKWCRPNYNSVIATFCYNIARDLPIKVHDPSVTLKLVYIDDVVNELIAALENRENRSGIFCEVPISYNKTVGEIADLIYSFRKSRDELIIPNMSDDFIKKLYSTYLSYLPEDNLSYKLKMNIDNRGSFTECFKSPYIGQVSVNIIKPGVVKGNHWHHTKTEKFLTISGKGVIRLRKIDSDKIIEYFVSDEKLEIVDIPAGFTHNIENLGDTDMVTLMWANELFNREKPDTFYLNV